MSADIFSNVKNESEEYIKGFINVNIGGPNYTNPKGGTPLHLAAEHAGNAKVIKVLVSMGANVNATEYSGGFTPLHIATIYGRVDAVEALISYGADVNAREVNGFTPLHMAAVSKNTAGDKNIEIAKFLISKGADYTAKSNVNAKGESYTPFDLARNVSKDMPMMLCLLDNESIENIKQYIKVNIPNVNFQDDTGWTLLHCAAYEQYVKVAKILISSGADVNICEENGLTPLDMAIGGGKVKIVEILLPYVSDINTRDKNNLTLLHKAAISGKMAGDKNIEIAKLLVSKGADVNARADKGTPLDMAKEVGDKAMVQYLIKEYDKAIKDFNEAIRLDPKNKSAYMGLGAVYLSKEEYDLSIRNYENALQLDPNDKYTASFLENAKNRKEQAKRERIEKQRKEEQERIERKHREEQERMEKERREEQERIEKERREEEDAERRREEKIKARVRKIGRISAVLLALFSIIMGVVSYNITQYPAGLVDFILIAAMFTIPFLIIFFCEGWGKKGISLGAGVFFCIVVFMVYLSDEFATAAEAPLMIALCISYIISCITAMVFPRESHSIF